MGVLLSRLAERKLLVSDGAWGTMLHAKGLGDECPEAWNVSHPDRVSEVARAYVEAGSDVILTNTFGGSAPKLARFGLEDRAAEFNAAGARLSLEAAGGAAVVAASVGPTGEFMEPYGALSVAQMEAIYRAQFEPMFEAGLEAVCIETFTAIEEVCCAVRAAKALKPEADIAVTMVFDPSPNGFVTMMGVSPAQMAEEAVAAGADIVGANCGNGIERMVEVTQALRAASGAPILIHANAGLPKLVEGATVFDQTPEVMSESVTALVKAGANIIGGCCGTTPAHIAAIKAVVDTLRA